MSEVMGMVQAGDDAQGVVVALGVCGYVAGSGCAGVAAPWICVCRWWCVCHVYCVVSVVG